MSGHRPFRELTKPIIENPRRRRSVAAYRTMMEAAVSLQRLREQRGITQVDLATALEVTQGNVSRTEHAPDVYLSTLRRYVEALGGHLEIAAVFPDDIVALDLPIDA